MRLILLDKVERLYTAQLIGDMEAVLLNKKELYIYIYRLKKAAMQRKVNCLIYLQFLRICVVCSAGIGQCL